MTTRRVGNLQKMARACKLAFSMPAVAIKFVLPWKGTAVRIEFQTSLAAVKSTKTVLGKCGFIWNNGPVNIWNYCKASK